MNLSKDHSYCHHKNRIRYYAPPDGSTDHSQRSLSKHLNPSINLQKCRTKEHVKRHHRDAISKIQTKGNSTTLTTQFLQQKNYKTKETERDGKP